MRQSIHIISNNTITAGFYLDITMNTKTFLFLHWSRIVNLDTVNIPFIEDTIIEDPEDYFYYILGASLPKEATPQKVVLQFSQHRYPYAVAKPIHPTQRTNDADRTITLEIIPNRELEAVILSFGKDIEVIEPQQLRESIASVITESYKKYEVLKNGCKSPL